MTSDEIRKYSDRSLPWLLNKTQFYFNRFIRLRDYGNQCISCNSWNTAHASHYYNVGHYSSMRFNEDNCHVSCMQCNKYKRGNLLEYRKKLIVKIGIDRVNELDRLSEIHKRKSVKWDRITLIEKLEYYKKRCRELT